MISTQQNWDEILVQFKLLTTRKGHVYKSNDVDKLKINQIKYTVNH